MELTSAYATLPIEQANEVILKSVVSGLVYNLLGRMHKGFYSGMLRTEWTEVCVHPSSSLYFRKPGEKPFVVATEVFQTEKRYARICANVPAKWIPDLVPQRCVIKARFEDFNCDARTVKLKELFFYEGDLVDIRKRELTFSEAAKLQSGLVAIAENKGLLLLYVTQKRTDLGGMAWEAASKGGEQYLLSFTTKPDNGEGYYYCSLARNSPGGAQVAYIHFPYYTELDEIFEHSALAREALN